MKILLEIFSRRYRVSTVAAGWSQSESCNVSFVLEDTSYCALDFVCQILSSSTVRRATLKNGIVVTFRTSFFPDMSDSLA